MPIERRQRGSPESFFIIMHKAMDIARDIRELSAANIQDSPFDEKGKMELRQNYGEIDDTERDEPHQHNLGE